jgi:hypothetical protein
VASASFTVNTVAHDSTAHAVAYASTVNLALVSTVGVNTITWSIVSTSISGLAIPTITPAGSPLGATASFAMPADPSDNLGRSFIVKCHVIDNAGNALDAYAVVGAVNVRDIVPFCVDELNYRNSTHGWAEDLNLALANGVGGSVSDNFVITDTLVDARTANTRVSAGVDTRRLDTRLPADVTAPASTNTTVYSEVVPEDSSVLISVVVMVLNAVDDEDNTTQEFKARYDNIGGTVTERIMQAAGDFDGDTSYLTGSIAGATVSIIYNGPAGDLFPTVQVVGTPPGAWA